MAESLFTKIIARQIPARIAFEDAQYIAIHDLHPQAPLHLLLIPKKPIASLNDVSAEDAPLIGGLFPLAARLMKKWDRTIGTYLIAAVGRDRRFFTCICTFLRVGNSLGHPAEGCGILSRSKLKFRPACLDCPTMRRACRHKRFILPGFTNKKRRHRLSRVGVFRRGENAPGRVPLKLPILSYGEIPSSVNSGLSHHDLDKRTIGGTHSSL